METKTSKFDIAMEQLDRIAAQLQRGLISQKDFDGQRLLILVELSIASVNEFEKGK
jgi:hypothetical protein